MRKQLLVDTEHVVAVEQDFGGDTVVITFNDMGFLRNELRFWGDDFLLQQGISAFGIVTPKPNWYPRPAMDDVIAAILEKIAGRRVITYGHGHGGYGALKFSAQLKAAVALAFCPQWSINPADVNSFDSRFEKYFSEALRNGLRVGQEDLCKSAFVVYDKTQRLDSAQVAKLAPLNGVKTIAAPFSLHDMAHLATQGRSAEEFIRLCTGPAPPEASQLRQIVRASRNDSRSYLNTALRQLILRVNRSPSRSSAFVSLLIDKTNNKDNPFYTALIRHATGNTNLALSDLRKVKAQHIKPRDLLPLWQVAKALNFFEAELVVAAQICEKLASNTWACLCAVSTFIRARDFAHAHLELTRLTKQGDAENYIPQFIEYALQLKKPEIIEALLAAPLPRSPKVSILFGLVNYYRQEGNRANAFRHVMDLAQICADSPEDLRKIATCFVDLGEYSSALDIRRRLFRSAPGDYLLALDIVDLKARIPLEKDKKRARAELKKVHFELTEIMKAPDLPPAAWERASNLYESLGDLGAALRAIRKAVVHLEAGFEARNRVVVLLARKGRRRSARRELKVLFGEYGKDPTRLRILGKLALWLRDSDLAQKIAEAQFECEPNNPEGILYLARQLRMVGDRSRARRLLSDLFRAERQTRFISAQQSARLAQELYEAGDAILAKEALAEAVAREPNSEVVRKLVATISLTDRLGARVSPNSAHVEADPELVRPSFFSRLSKILQR
jgi:tetratricopeptide (TPR) repeat protein